jgi:hypothetical protein
MKIVGYFALWVIAFALFVGICAVLRDSIIMHKVSVQKIERG